MNPPSSTLRLLPFSVGLVVAFGLLVDAYALAPLNDNFSNATIITGLPFSGGATTVDATAEVGEPDHADGFGNIVSNSVWWSWTSVGGGEIEVIVEANGSFDSTLAVYEGDPFAVPPTIVAEADLADENDDESVTFGAKPGTTYFIVVDGYSGSGSVEWEGPFTLQVMQTPAPDNDLFANARVLGPALPANDAGTTVGATAEVGEPNHANASGGNIASNSVWWTWQASASQTVAVWVAGEELDGIIGVYTGTAVNALTEIASADVFLEGGSEQAVFAATGGTTYRIAIDADSLTGAPSPDSDEFNLVIIGLPANDDFANAQNLGSQFPIPGVSGSTIGATEESAGGEPEHATTLGGNLASNSVWYRWTSPVNGIVRVMASDADFDNAVAVYTGSALASLTEVASADLSGGNYDERVAFQSVQGTEYRIAVDGYAFLGNRTLFQSGQFSLIIEPAPANDDFANAEAISGALPLTVSGTTVNATEQFPFGEPDHAFDVAENNVSNSVWYSWTAPSAMSVDVSVENATFDNVLAVYTGTALNDLTLVVETDLYVTGQPEEVNFQAVAATTYFIVVDGYSDSGSIENEGTFDLVLAESSLAPYDAWIALYPSLTGPDALPGANPAGDGIPNILKLVFGLDPTISVSTDPNRANAPAMTTLNGNPAIQYTVAPANLGSGSDAIQHAGETSSDLQSWSSAVPVNTVGDTWVLGLDAQNGRIFGRITATDPSAP